MYQQIRIPFDTRVTPLLSSHVDCLVFGKGHDWVHFCFRRRIAVDGWQGRVHCFVQQL